MTSDRIMLGHGSGGIMMQQLLDEVIFNSYSSKELVVGDDAAILDDIVLSSGERLAFSADSFVVTPQFFPGGDIGHLAVCGTINDVATSGAKPVAISISFILEEGYKIDNLKKICTSIANIAKEANVRIVTGDTKVVEQGKVDGIFINTSGVGIVPAGVNLSGKNCKPGDAVIVSGFLGDHGIAIMSKRQGLKFDSILQSDAAPLNSIVDAVVSKCSDVRCFRDPTRGGLASTLNEFAKQSNCDFNIDQDNIPVRDSVNAACEMLGLDPLQVANEGKLVCVVAQEQAEDALIAIRSSKYGEDAQIIGRVEKAKKNQSPKVYVKTPFGTTRILDMLVGQQLPRIC